MASVRSPVLTSVTSGVRREVRLFFVALQFLTRIPVPTWVGFESEWMNRSVRHFPLVGALIGSAGAAVAFAAGILWSPGVAAALAVAFTVWLTAAFHEDGLADTADALFGFAPRDKALEIMKDSRIGSYGAAVLGLGLLLRVLLLADLIARDLPLAMAALVAAHAAGRAACVALMTVLPYGGDEAHAKAKPLARDVPAVDAIVAAVAGVLLLVPAALASPGAGARPIAACVLVLFALVVGARGWLRRRLGGYTGDTLGASEQAGEILVLLVFAAAARG